MLTYLSDTGANKSWDFKCLPIKFQKSTCTVLIEATRIKV